MNSLTKYVTFKMSLKGQKKAKRCTICHHNNVPNAEHFLFSLGWFIDVITVVDEFIDQVRSSYSSFTGTQKIKIDAKFVFTITSDIRNGTHYFFITFSI